MKVLWITNIIFPEEECLLSGSSDFKSSGGWMLGAANNLIKQNGIKLFVANVSDKVRKLTILKGHSIEYYVIPLGSRGNIKINTDYVEYWKEIIAIVQPDVVHIHGTEFSHGHAYMSSNSCHNVVLSIQGLTSVCYRHFLSGLSFIDVLKNLTIRDLVFGTMFSHRKLYKSRGAYEKEMICMAENIIGRTNWDRSHSWAINPKASYFFCNETLREEFYDNSVWKYAKCKKHSIFLSQGGNPIKGLHQVLKAMPYILLHYPDVTIRIAGIDITKNISFADKLRLTGYGLYIKKLIRKLKLEDKVHFTGNLNAQEMKDEYLKANVFICPSSIENSPNSLGEAQILGVPCVASYVGGIPDMMLGNENNLYRFEDVEVLALKVCQIFDNKDNQVDMRSIANERHNPELNSTMLSNIYKNIMLKKV